MSAFEFDWRGPSSGGRPAALPLAGQSYLSKLLSTPPEALDRIIEDVMSNVVRLGDARLGCDPAQTERTIESLVRHLRNRSVFPSVRILRQAMRLDVARPHAITHLASSWTARVDWRRPFAENADEIKRIFVEGGAGSGFILDRATDPVDIAQRLNDLLASFDSPIPTGASAFLSVRHPRVRQFIACKADGAQMPFVGTSICLTPRFMAELTEGEGHDIWHRIIESAWRCGDPGVILPHEFPNGTPRGLGRRTPATCADLSLYPDERCVFLYVNVAAFLPPGQPWLPHYDFAGLIDAVKSMARVGDAALALGLPPGERAGSDVNALRRKLSIAPFGVSDLAWAMRVPYGSPAFERMLDRVLDAFSYAALSAGAELAEERGAYPMYRRGAAKPRAARASLAEPTATGVIPSGITKQNREQFEQSRRLAIKDMATTPNLRQLAFFRGPLSGATPVGHSH